jgi:hypothetical protein
MSSNVSDSDFYNLENTVRMLQGTVRQLVETQEGLIQQVGSLQLQLENKYYAEDDEDTQPGMCAPPVPLDEEDNERDRRIFTHYGETVRIQDAAYESEYPVTR